MSKNFKPIVGILCMIIVAVIIRFIIIKDKSASNFFSTNEEIDIRRNSNYGRSKWQ